MNFQFQKKKSEKNSRVELQSIFRGAKIDEYPLKDPPGPVQGQFKVQGSNILKGSNSFISTMKKLILALSWTHEYTFTIFS